MITIEQASRFAKLPLASIHREYPNKLDHVINDAGDVVLPSALHPAFYGCFDWHSAVHGHWMLVRLLKLFPQLPEATEIRAAIDRSLTPENIAVEVAYVHQPNRQSFERMYGWAWLFQLASELHGFDARWAATLQPLVDVFVERTHELLQKQTYAIRTGVHPNTAFALALILDHARAVGNAKLETLVVERARGYFANDVDYPAHLEPGGEDFLSPALIEADLMRRVMPLDEFTRWLRAFLPKGLPRSLATPAICGDRTDPKLVHLDGLNLSRAWCLRALAKALPPDDAAAFAAAAEAHADAGLAHVTTGNYVGEHWLATFAVYMLTT